MSALLECIGVHWRPPSFPGPLIEGLSFAIGPGEALAIDGPHGSGCSTVGELALGGLEPDEGRVLLFGEEPAALDDDGLAALRRRVGICPARGALLSNLTLAENIALPVQWGACASVDPAPAVERALALLGVANLPRIRPTGAPPELAALAALARALVREPQLLVVDDHCRGLAPDAAKRIWTRLDQARRERGFAILALGIAAPAPDWRSLTLPARMHAAGGRRVPVR